MTLLITNNQQLTTSYIGRIAPSPTGLLHLGHARTFWTAHQRAREHNGTLLFRNEDLDPQRSKLEFVEAMHEDLTWLGITWHSELTQSTRIPLYRAALEQLITTGYAYPCYCSRKDLQQSIEAPHEEETTNPLADPADEPIYNNHCRPSSSEPWALSPEPCSYRFRIPTDDPITFIDLNAGPQSFTPTIDFGDFLIWRKQTSKNPEDIGLPSYQLACVVDDASTQITEVVRGRDLLKSTARQILLQRALSLPTPNYFHCNLMRDIDGIRLAKRHDALSIRTLRNQNLTPTQLRAMF